MEAQLEIIKSTLSKISKGIWLCSPSIPAECSDWSLSSLDRGTQLGEVEVPYNCVLQVQIGSQKTRDSTCKIDVGLATWLAIVGLFPNASVSTPLSTPILSSLEVGFLYKSESMFTVSGSKEINLAWRSSQTVFERLGMFQAPRLSWWALVLIY